MLIIYFSRINDISDKFLKEKWILTEANLKSEYMQVIQIYEVSSTFKVFYYFSIN